MVHDLSIITDFESIFPDYRLKDGALYIVSTPIGSLEEISLRALYVLQNAGLIACEDTRITSVLLNHYGIKSKLISYYSRVEISKLDYLITELQKGVIVALVTDAGTPGISDPGNVIISECIKKEIDIVSVPGASAMIHALVVSGFENKKFFFQGFLPLKGRENVYLKLKEYRMPIIIYESKFRIRKTVKEIALHFPNRDISVSREMTKLHEQTYRGRAKEINPDSIKEKGEFTLVINNI